ncbi:MAG: PQQ-binding-like beta-propeller repeat protein [Gammaproteobacteria bacterium]
MTFRTLFCTVLSAMAGAACAPCVLAADVDWPMYNQTYDAQRYSSLKQIDATNVAGLKEVCRVRVGELGGFGGSPIVVGGMMYVTVGNATLAMNPVDCGIKWKTLYVSEGRASAGAATRGAAFSDGRLFRGTGDGHVTALDAASGRELWRTKGADSSVGESLSAAPIVWDNKVFIGIAGSEMGVHGRILAFDATTGAIRWQFNTVPQGTQFGVDTWKGDSWKTGGGGTWSTLSLDPETGELFIPVGNPSPDFFLPHRDVRRKTGANLFTNSIVAVDARTGHLDWYFQATPSDDKDLDQAAAPMLFKLGDGRAVLAAASKDGYLRVIDRKTHRLLYKLPVTTIRNEDKPVTAKGLETCPGTLGGTQWNGPAYDTSERAIVVGAVDWCSFLRRENSVEYKPGAPFYGGSIISLMNPAPSGWLTSVNADTGALRWKFHAPAPIVSGITPTAGGVTFFGDVAGTFYAVRSSDGSVLLRTPTGGGISGGIVTYTISGRQYVAVTSGNLSRTMWVSSGLPHMILYTVGDVAPDAGLAASGGSMAIERGGGVFVRSCAACHGFGGGGGTGPSLKGVGKRLAAEQLAGQIRAPRRTDKGPATMPPFDAQVLPDASVQDVVAFLETL